MNQKQNEKISIIVGLLLIFFVGIITFARMTKNQDKQDATPTPSTKPATPIKTIKPEELQERLQKSEKITIIDIRDEAIYMKSHILDSVHLSLDEIRSQQDLHLPLKNPVVIVGESTTDISMAEAFDALEKQGFKDIMALSGGLTGWENSGGTVISSGNPASITDLAKVTLLSSGELQKELEASDVQIIDARPKEQFLQGHIRGAINIPFEEIEGRRNEIDTKKIIVVYDTDEIQGFQSGVRINDLFIITPFVLRGGFTKWQADKLEVVQ